MIFFLRRRNIIIKVSRLEYINENTRSNYCVLDLQKGF